MTGSDAKTTGIDRARVLHIAKLSALSLTDEEADRFAGELEAIVKYVAELDAVDTSNVTPMATPALELENGRASERADWRDDEVKPGLSHEDALAQAPRVEHEGFAVPGFVES